MPKLPARAKSLCLKAGLAGWLTLASPRPARAEDAVSYKYEDYREAGGRIAVKTQSALIRHDFGTETHLQLAGTIDAIAGATPNGQPAPAGSDQVVLTELHERRKAWNADFSRQFSNFNLALGVANSRESDYVSTGWSVNTLFDFNEKNTTLLAGVAGTDDDVKVYFQSPWAKKRTHDVIVGVKQLLDPNTSVAFNLTWDHTSGFLSDQYKLVQKQEEVAPGVFLPFTFGENRPTKRDKWIALASINRAFLDLHAALEASYRFYHDTFGTDAHTLDLTWFQHLGRDFLLMPVFRYYQQSAANFYYYQLDKTSIMPISGAPNPAGPFYSSDYRLSSLRATTYGLKARWAVAPHFAIDAKFERYDMHGRDGATSQSAYPRADITTVGVEISW